MKPVARVIALAALLLTAAAPSTPAAGDIVAKAPRDAWRAVAPDDLLIMDLAGGSRVAIELAPDFAPVHVANIRALAHAHWFDGTAIVRVQDDYVVQWGGAEAGKPLPPGLVAHPPAEYDRPREGLTVTPLGSRDSYAPAVGFGDGWPVASDGDRVWLTHCYAMAGVGRDMPPDTGSGAELYAVIGQAPRHLDRNIALVGRVLDGMPALAALPRGKGDLGFYKEATERRLIVSVRLASDMPVAGRPTYQVMRTDSPSFARYVEARANRRDAFFVRPAGAVDLCNAPVPSRRMD